MQRFYIKDETVHDAFDMLEHPTGYVSQFEYRKFKNTCERS